MNLASLAPPHFTFILFHRPCEFGVTTTTTTTTTMMLSLPLSRRRRQQLLVAQTSGSLPSNQQRASRKTARRSASREHGSLRPDSDDAAGTLTTMRPTPKPDQELSKFRIIDQIGRLNCGIGKTLSNQSNDAEDRPRNFEILEQTMDESEEQLEMVESDAFYTVEQSSVSCGPPLGTSEVDSDSTEDEVSTEDDDRIGIRPFPKGHHSDLLSFGTPELLPLPTSTCSEVQEEAHHNSKEDEWIHFGSFDKDAASTQAFGDEVLLQQDNKTTLINITFDPYAHTYLAPPSATKPSERRFEDEQTGGSALETARVESHVITSPTNTTNALLVEPPELERRHSLCITDEDLLEHETESFFASSYHDDMFAPESKSAHEPLPMSLFGSKRVHSFRSSSPGIEPAVQQRRNSQSIYRRSIVNEVSSLPCFIASQRSEGSVGTSSVQGNRATQASPQSCPLPRRSAVPLRVHTAETGASPRLPPAMYVQSRLRSGVNSPQSGHKEMETRDRVVSANASPEVRWNSTLVPAISTEHALVDRPTSPESNIRSKYRAKSPHAITTSRSEFVSNVRLCWEEQSCTSLDATMVRQLDRETTERIQGSSSDAGDSEFSQPSSTVQDLINKFNSNASRRVGLKSLRYQERVLPGKLSDTPYSEARYSQRRHSASSPPSIPSLLGNAYALKDETSAVNSNETLQLQHSPARSSLAQVQCTPEEDNSARSGFFWRSHPSTEPMCSSNDSSRIARKVGQAISPSNSMDADGMTATTEITHGTTTDDEGHDSRQYKYRHNNTHHHFVPTKPTWTR